MGDNESTIIEKAKERLLSFGYEFTDSDSITLCFSARKVENSIKNDCNVSEIPKGLMYIAADMAVGEFLMAKKIFAPDSLTGLDLGVAVKQIQEGDTNTVFAIGEGSSTDEQRLDSLINHLLNYGRGEFSCYRRIRW